MSEEFFTVGVRSASQSETITFYCASVEVLKLTTEGMYYRGELVKDAGEAHRAWCEAMGIMKCLPPRSI